MKFSKKFLLVLSLVALLATLFATTAFAASAKEVYQQHATITKVKVLDDQPATFRVMGSYACDKVRIQTQVSGKTIYINVWDVKNKGNDCSNHHRFDKTVTVAPLVPGTYTVLFNVDPETGKAQRKIKGLIAPLIPATPTPASQTE
jgi:hypothetical protein